MNDDPETLIRLAPALVSWGICTGLVHPPQPQPDAYERHRRAYCTAAMRRQRAEWRAAGLTSAGKPRKR